MLNVHARGIGRAPQAATLPKFQGDLHRRQPEGGNYEDQIAFQRKYEAESARIRDFENRFMKSRHGENPVETEESLHKEYIEFCEQLPEPMTRYLQWALEKASEFHVENKQWEKAEPLLERALTMKMREDIEPRFHDLLRAPHQEATPFLMEQYERIADPDNWTARLDVPKSYERVFHKTHDLDLSNTAELLGKLAKTKAGLGKAEEAERFLQQKFMLLSKLRGLHDLELKAIRPLFELADLAGTRGRKQDQYVYSQVIELTLLLNSALEPHLMGFLHSDLANQLIPLGDLALEHGPDRASTRDHARSLYKFAKEYYKAGVSRGSLDNLMPLSLAYRKLSEVTEDPVERQVFQDLTERYTQTAHQLGMQELENILKPAENNLRVSAYASETLSDPAKAASYLDHWRGLLANETDPEKKELWKMSIDHYEKVRESFDKKAISDAVEPAPDVVITVHSSGFMKITVVQ